MAIKKQTNSENKRKVIAIDCGKKNLKAMGDVDIIKIYRNKLSLGSSEIVDDNSWNVLFEAADYTVGDVGKYSYKKEGKCSPEHKIQSLTAITRFLDSKEKNDDIVVIYGESTDFYYKAGQRDSIKKMLEGRHRIMVDEENFEFNVSTVHVLPEGIGHILTDLEKYLGIQIVVDMGGKTINFLYVDNGCPIEDFSFSEPLGMSYIITQVDKSLRKCGEYLDERMIEEHILNRDAAPDLIRSRINEVFYKLLDKFDDILEDRGIDIHSYVKNKKVSFTGGTVASFEDLIEDHYGKNANIVENPLTSNVEGFYAFGVAKYMG